MTADPAEIARALAELDERLSEIGSCSDGNCLVLKPKGMHTNGGCRCLYHAHIRVQRFAHAHNRFVNAVRSHLEDATHD
jgi:hypothetical protein